MTLGYPADGADPELREFLERMAAIVEKSPDFIATVTAGGRFLTLNLAGRALVGIGPREEVAGRPIASLYPAWASAQLEEIARPSARQHGSWTGRSALLSAAGEEIPTSQVVVAHRDAEGELRYFSTTIRDLTEERRAENRLQTEIDIAQQLETSESLEDALPGVLGAFLTNLKAARAELWVTGASGLERTFMRRAQSDQAVHIGATDATGVHHALEETDSPVVLWSPSSESESVNVIPFPYRTALAFEVRSGSESVGVIAVYWTLDTGDIGLAAMALHVARDVAAFVRRERAEASMLQAQVLAEEANRAKSQFLANMSHEIRTPLTAIFGYADLLEQSLRGEDNRQLLNTIQRNARHLHDVVNDILDLSQIEAGKVTVTPTVTSPIECAVECLALLRLQAAEQGIFLSGLADGPVPATFSSDPVRVRQILLNLLGNALKFTEQGSVTLRMSTVDAHVCFRVDDSGIGIDPDTIGALFEPFNQSDNSAGRAYQGTGLGLSISRGLAQVLGGAIWAESTPGEGSSFFLSIPVGLQDVRMVEQSAATMALNDAPVAPPARSPDPVLDARVLVVDDRVDIRVMVARILEEAGAEVEMAVNGRAAVDMCFAAAREDRPYAAVVMDLQMPVMDGLTATRKLREGGYNGGVIALTAGALQRDRAKALAVGCDEVVTKPVDTTHLIDVLARTINASRPPDVDEAAHQPGPALTVLLIEDDPDVADLMATLFSGWGCRVLTAHSGAEALAQGSSTSVDVVFSDLNLPDLSGVELLPQLKAIPTCMGAIFVSLTGFGGEQGRRLSETAGFAVHLVKPASFADLKAILASAEKARELDGSRDPRE